MRRVVSGLGLMGLVVLAPITEPARAAMTFDDYTISPMFRSCRNMGGMSREACTCVAMGIYQNIDRPDEQIATILLQGFPMATLRTMGPAQLTEALGKKGIYANEQQAGRVSNTVTGTVDYCLNPQGAN